METCARLQEPGIPGAGTSLVSRDRLGSLCQRLSSSSATHDQRLRFMWDTFKSHIDSRPFNNLRMITIALRIIENFKIYKFNTYLYSLENLSPHSSGPFDSRLTHRHTHDAYYT